MTPNPPTPEPRLTPVIQKADAALTALQTQMVLARESAATWDTDIAERLPAELAWLEARRQEMQDATTPITGAWHVTSLVGQVRRERLFRPLDGRVLRYRLVTRARRAQYTLLVLWQTRIRILIYGIAIAAAFLLIRSLPALVVILDWLVTTIAGLFS